MESIEPPYTAPTGPVLPPDPGVPPYRRPLPLRLLDGLAWAIDRGVGWWRLPKLVGLGVLVGLRSIMRRKNLIDTSHDGVTGPEPVEDSPSYRTARAPDGSHNDPRNPRMGMAGSRFGRNMPADHPETDADVLEPNARTISRALMTRTTFQPADGINALSAAWLQFMIRDWFHHERGTDSCAWEVELAPGDVWPPSCPGSSRILRIPKTPGGPRAYSNVNSHWWDGSQLYGNDAATQKEVRSGHDGKLVDPGRGVLPPRTAADPPGSDPGYWLGLAMLQILFIREHNAICDRLHERCPDLTDDDLFERARLVNAALIAKIHTLEWTPTLIARPTTVAGMSAIWYGILGQRFRRRFGRVFRSAALSGIVGSDTNHFGVPFSITEEFSAVYRMHPLIPDDWTFPATNDRGEPVVVDFRDLTGPEAVEKYLGEYSLGELFSSFGAASAGRLGLGNFPKSMQEFRLPDGGFIDLAATDILRVREFGVPRYNEFRRRLGLRPRRSIEDLTADPEWAGRIAAVYGGDIEKVDLLVGLLAEDKPGRFAFSDSTFRIFLLMASRRMNSDRFFTTDFNAKVYTRAGLDWIERNTMGSVLRRHLPELGPALDAQGNPFAPFGR